MSDIDHVLYGAQDLDAAADRLEAHLGLVAIAGGRHEGMGTENRIVPLGGGYIELIAIADADEAASSPFGSGVRDHIERKGEGLIGWAVATDDVDGVAARLGTPIVAIGRAGLTARLTGVAESLREPFLPFFIERDAGVADPGAAGDAGGISWLEVAGDEDRLVDWLGGVALPVRVVQGEPAVRAMGIGDRELR